ncbi:hypothetical protein D9611_012300 [Ephemerocybe angulata]|uniref:Uncharacterized protein n=1 Tax=Ephemerocybe angulata TaxID=980116 RepID=A0A8H5ES90_9AGAR|nr:hypothetical protein D9611_012300 [Tulosesus angulatus]
MFRLSLLRSDMDSGVRRVEWAARGETCLKSEARVWDAKTRIWKLWGISREDDFRCGAETTHRGAVRIFTVALLRNAQPWLYRLSRPS